MRKQHIQVTRNAISQAIPYVSSPSNATIMSLRSKDASHIRHSDISRNADEIWATSLYNIHLLVRGGIPAEKIGMQTGVSFIANN